LAEPSFAVTGSLLVQQDLHDLFVHEVTLTDALFEVLGVAPIHEGLLGLVAIHTVHRAVIVALVGQSGLHILAGKAQLTI